MVMTPSESDALGVNPQKELQFPLEKPQVTSDLSNNVILTTINDLYSWAKMSSVWPLL